MRDSTISFTYGELIEAFETWNNILEAGEIPDLPVGNTVGEQSLNFLIELVNDSRRERLTTYRK